MPHVPLEPVDGVTITTLVDNAADMLLPDQGPAKRPGLGESTPRLPAAFFKRAWVWPSAPAANSKKKTTSPAPGVSGP